MFQKGKSYTFHLQICIDSVANSITNNMLQFYMENAGMLLFDLK